jgi:hypothetical protein
MATLQHAGYVSHYYFKYSMSILTKYFKIVLFLSDSNAILIYSYAFYSSY